MANNTHRFSYLRAGSALLLLLAGLWAAGLTPLDAFGPPPGADAGSPDKPAAPGTRLKGMSSSAGRRITTVSIETSDPAAYVTSRPDPLTLFVDLREVDASGARSMLLGAKGLLSGAAIEQATGADGTRIARVRIRLTSPAAHQVRSKRNIIHIDFDSAFPLGSRGARVRRGGCPAGIVAVCDHARERQGRTQAERRGDHAHRKRGTGRRIGHPAWRRHTACRAVVPERSFPGAG